MGLSAAGGHSGAGGRGSAVLILLPLAFARSELAAPRALRLRAGAYFLAIGLGFMFVEIAFIQKLVLFLGHPLYAVTVVLFSFLLFAGLGARLSPPLLRGRSPAWPMVAIAALVLLDLLLLSAPSHWIVLPAAAAFSSPWPSSRHWGWPWASVPERPVQRGGRRAGAWSGLGINMRRWWAQCSPPCLRCTGVRCGAPRRGSAVPVRGGEVFPQWPRPTPAG